MGGMASLMGKLPGMGQIPDNVKSQMDDKVLVRMEAIINSMTMKERAKPEIIKGSRKRRIAAGCGMQVQDVNRLWKQFDDMQRMMKKMKKGGMAKMMRGMKGMMPPGSVDKYIGLLFAILTPECARNAHVLRVRSAFLRARRRQTGCNGNAPV